MLIKRETCLKYHPGLECDLYTTKSGVIQCRSYDRAKRAKSRTPKKKREAQLSPFERFEWTD